MFRTATVNAAPGGSAHTTTEEMPTMTADVIRNGLAPYLGKPRTIPIGKWPLAAVDCYSEAGIQIFVTTGLSELSLDQPDKGVITQELLFACRGEHDDDVVGLLGVISEQVANRGSAMVRGEVIGPAGPLIQSSSLTAVVATLPVFLPDSAVFYPGEPATVLVWLLPLSSGEAALARKLGSERFESVLDKMAESADLYDLNRQEIY
jgi:Suppressor of fused protein (SUFU)